MPARCSIETSRCDACEERPFPVFNVRTHERWFALSTCPQECHETYAACSSLIASSIWLIREAFAPCPANSTFLSGNE